MTCFNYEISSSQLTTRCLFVAELTRRYHLDAITALSWAIMDLRANSSQLGSTGPSPRVSPNYISPQEHRTCSQLPAILRNADQDKRNNPRLRSQNSTNKELAIESKSQSWRPKVEPPTPEYLTAFGVENRGEPASFSALHAWIEKHRPESPESLYGRIAQ